MPSCLHCPDLACLRLLLCACDLSLRCYFWCILILIQACGGSTMVCDLPRLEALLEAGQPWAEGTAKYCITRDQYPGIRQMIRGA